MSSLSNRVSIYFYELRASQVEARVFSPFPDISLNRRSAQSAYAAHLAELAGMLESANSAKLVGVSESAILAKLVGVSESANSAELVGVSESTYLSKLVSVSESA